MQLSMERDRIQWETLPNQSGHAAWNFETKKGNLIGRSSDPQKVENRTQN